MFIFFIFYSSFSASYSTSFADIVIRQHIISFDDSVTTYDLPVSPHFRFPVYTSNCFRMVITRGISRSTCIAIKSSAILDMYRFLTTTFFSYGISLEVAVGVVMSAKRLYDTGLYSNGQHLTCSGRIGVYLA